MKDDILSYREMCDRESMQTLQRGMNYRLTSSYSVVLMSQRTNAPYQDQILDDGVTLIYEGHDIPRTDRSTNPKQVDQPYQTANGTFTQNGKFARAVDEAKRGEVFEKVRVYEKLFSGVWSYKGLFELVDYEYVTSGIRKVFRFRLILAQSEEAPKGVPLQERSRIIPTAVKKIVWERDGGKCVICGSKDELHFDHDIPYSRGGTSIKPENVRILCARHNLQKSDRIE